MLLDEWDESEIEALVNLESLISEDSAAKGVEEDVNVNSSSDSEDEDESVKALKCTKCRKVYHTVGWLRRHEGKCTGANENTAKKKQQMSEHQMKTRVILADLGFDDYFVCDCVPGILKYLRELTSSSSETFELRGSRFANCKSQAEILVAELGKEDSNEVTAFFKYVAKHLWTVTFARDHLLSSSSRHQYVAQHLNEFRQAGELALKWNELSNIIGIDPTDKLLLQQIISVVFEDISRYRTESVASALKIREKYTGETTNKPSLTPVENDIVAYIAGYVCRKTRDRLQRYCDSNAQSSNHASQDKCRRLERIVKVLNQMIPGVGKQSPAMTYPNLLTLSLTRGGLAQVNRETFIFFCYLEVSIRPFLNLASLSQHSKV